MPQYLLLICLLNSVTNKCYMKKQRIIILTTLIIIALTAVCCITIYSYFLGNTYYKTGLAIYNISLYFTYILLILSIIAGITFPVYNIIRYPHKSKRIMIAAALLLTIFISSFLLSPSFSGDFYILHDITPIQSKFINAGLITSLIIFATTIMVLIYDSIINKFR